MLDQFKHPLLPSYLSKSQRRKKRAHKGSENVKRKSAKPGRVGRAGGSHGKQKHVEAVTLFEVVTMGRSAMQVKMANPQPQCVCLYSKLSYLI